MLLQAQEVEASLQLRDLGFTTPKSGMSRTKPGPEARRFQMLSVEAIHLQVVDGPLCFQVSSVDGSYLFLNFRASF